VKVLHSTVCSYLLARNKMEFIVEHCGQLDFSSLSDYQFVDQGILMLLLLVHTKSSSINYKFYETCLAKFQNNSTGYKVFVQDSKGNM